MGCYPPIKWRASMWGTTTHSRKERRLTFAATRPCIVTFKPTLWMWTLEVLNHRRPRTGSCSTQSKVIQANSRRHRQRQQWLIQAVSSPHLANQTHLKTVPWWACRTSAQFTHRQIGAWSERSQQRKSKCISVAWINSLVALIRLSMRIKRTN